MIFPAYLTAIILNCILKMNNWRFSKPIQWHGKGFSLQWKFPRAWLVLVHFNNGEKKRWFKRTERSYRFRRWFWRKGEDRFQNIASLHHPFISLFIFSGFSLFPKKQLIPMEVCALRVHEPELQLAEPNLHTALPFLSYQLPGTTLRIAQPGTKHPTAPDFKQSAPLNAASLQADFEHFKQEYSLHSNGYGNT